MKKENAYLLTDLEYALGQLKRCLTPGYCSTKGQDCVTRAIDALERVQINLEVEE